MKRIIFTVTNDLNQDQRMHRICNTLVENGYSVQLVGRRKKDSGELLQQKFLQKRLRCWFNKGKAFYFEYNIRLFFFLVFHRFDAICAIDLDTIMPAYAASVVKRKPRVYDAHEYFSEVPEVIRRPGVRRLWQWVERTFVPKFKLQYTVSGSIAYEFNKNYRSSTAVIRNLPLLDNSEITVAPSRDFIFYQGALNEGRGLELLFKSIRQTDISLHLAGEGDLSKELRLLAKELEIQDQVKFLGFVAPERFEKPYS